MASAIETSVVGFKGAFVANYGSSPGWLQALLAALMNMLPSLLSGCGITPTPAGIKTGMAENPIGVDIQFHRVAREAGVPLLERGRASAAMKAAIDATPDTDMANLLQFAQAS